jgi:hypothetical protein
MTTAADPTTPVLERTVEEPPQFKLFHPRSVLFATVLGSPLAGSLLLGLNFRRLGRRRAAGAIVAVGCFVLVGTIAFSVLSGGKAAGPLMAIGLAYVTFHFAKHEQGPAVERHVKNGGRLASPATAAVIGLGVCVAVVAGVFGLVYLVAAVPALDRTIGPYLNAASGVREMPVGVHGKIIYDGPWDDEARRAAEVLAKSPFGTVDHDWSVMLSKEDLYMKLRFVFAEERLNDPALDALFGQISGELNGRSPTRWVHVYVGDAQMRREREIRGPSNW